jgi:hypothetical protein
MDAGSNLCFIKQSKKLIKRHLFFYIEYNFSDGVFSYVADLACFFN